MPKRPEERQERWPQRVRAFWAREGKKITSIVLVIGLPILARDGYGKLDRLGFIRHSAIMSVSVDRDWWTGEFRTCYGTLADDGLLDALNCNQSSTTRTLPVVFWGRTAYEEHAHSFSARPHVVVWNCQRETERLTCRAQ